VTWNTYALSGGKLLGLGLLLYITKWGGHAGAHSFHQQLTGTAEVTTTQAIVMTHHPVCSGVMPAVLRYQYFTPSLHTSARQGQGLTDRAEELLEQGAWQHIPGDGVGDGGEDPVELTQRGLAVRLWACRWWSAEISVIKVPRYQSALYASLPKQRWGLHVGYDAAACMYLYQHPSILKVNTTSDNPAA
jgi:hypothetical protein